MTFKKLFSTFFVLLLFVGVVSAQTFYVNNAWGNDANSGTGPGVGLAKATVSSALLAAPGGSTISVAFTGINYTEATPGMNLLPGPLTAGVTGTYTFTSTGGTPIFTNAFQVGVVGGAAGTLTFTGPFQFNGLTLQNGTLSGGNQITITALAAVLRTELGSITAGQLAFAGTANFTYQNFAGGAGTVITTGLEFPVATNVANNLTLTATNANFVFRLDQNRQINGILNGNGEAGANTADINLNAFTLTINGANAHTIDGNPTGGTLAFLLTGAASIDAVVANHTLPTITADKATAGLAVLTIDPAGAFAITTVGSLTASNNASITSNNTGNIGNVTLNGAGTILTNNNGVVNDVLGAAGSTGTITLGNQAAGGAGTSVVNSITQSGRSTINFDVDTDGAGADNGTTTIAVTNNVLLNTVYNVVMAPGAVLVGGFINFPALPINTIGGNVTNSASVTGTTDQAYATAGNITFGSTTQAITITGNLVNNSTGTWTGAGSVTTFGRITFATTTGALTFTGGISNSSTLSGATSGDIFSTGGGGAATINTGAVSNTSTVANAHIDFANLTGGLTINSITSSGATTGGDVQFGSGSANIAGSVDNSRGAAGADINVGVGGPVGGNTFTANNVLNSGSSNINVFTTSTGAVTVNQSLSVTGSGQVNFPNTTTGTFTLRNVSVSNGTLFVGNGTGALAATGNVLLTGGTVNWGTGAAHTFAIGGGAGTNIQFGGVGTVVTMNNGNNLTIDFQQPVPNVNQNITLSTINQTFNGRITVTNAAIIPAPYVIFKSADPANVAPGNLYILNLGGAADALTFSTPAPPANPQNSVQLDNARLYIGLNNPGGTAGGDFQNTSGYQTINGGYVMMNGNAAQRVNNTAAPNAGATFGNFGVDNNGLAIAANADVAVINASTFTGDFYLAEGSIANTLVGWAATTNVQFNGPAPYPTIYRTEGTFRSAPTFNSLVNVTYYGNDKATSVEIPVAANRLQNLTVATTNGAQAGFGIVTMTGAATVNGTLTINANQSLYTGANALTLNGASAVINGYLVDDGTTRLQLAAAGGTVFSGNGWLPAIQVNAGSVGNNIAGRGVVSNGLGDGVWGGVADDFTTMDGSITYAGGAASSLIATFTAPVAPSTTNFLNLTTAAGATFTLGANAIMGGNMTHPAGAINLSTFNLTNNGTAPTMTNGATLVGTGNFIMPTAATIFTGVTAPGPTIGANVICNNAGGTVTLAGTNLRIDGNFTLGTTAPTTTTFANGGFNLTLGGTNVTFYGASAITGVGTTILLNTAPNTLLTWTVPAAATPAVTNLTVNGNVTLTGAASLTVNGVGTGFVMNAPGGTLTLSGVANLNIGGGGFAATPFNYQAGTITGAGYVIWSSTGTWTQGTGLVAAPLTLTNLQIVQALDITNGNANLIGSTLTIAGELYLNGFVLTQTRTVAPTGSLLNMNALTTMRVAGGGNIATGGANAVPIYAGLLNYIFNGGASAPNAFTIPLNQANNVTVTMGAAGNTVTPVASVNVAGNFTETVGQWVVGNGLTLGFPTVGSIIRVDRNGGTQAIALAAAPNPGLFTAADVNLEYTDIGATGTAYSAGVQYQFATIVRNLSIGVGPAASLTNVNLAFARTVDGTLTMFSTLNINANTTWSLAQTIPAGSFVTLAAATTSTWSNGLTANGSYVDAAATSVTLIPAGGLTVGGTGTFTINGTLGSLANPVGPIAVTAGLGGGFTNNGTVFSSGFTGPIAGLGANSIINLSGDATIGNVGALPATSATSALISTPNNLTFNGTFPAVPNYLNLTFTGTNNQTVALGANRQFQNINITKGNDGTVKFEGGNVTLNAVAAPSVAGNLNLTRGILWVENVIDDNPLTTTIDETVPAVLTLQLTVAGGIIQNLGWTRNLAQLTHFSHVYGKLGVAIPSGTIGRSEWPVGSINPHYRPASITFTAGNATIAPTTIIVSHVDATPTGTKNFPINGGTKFADPARTNWIGSYPNYYWLFEATTSLGAAQLMNVELNGTNLNRPLDNHNDLRIIRRFDGDVTVNGWFLEGNANNYSNAMYINTPAPGDTLLLVRNIGSTGSAIAQRALFTLGIPSGAPVFTATAPAAVVTPENTLYTFDFNANDQDLGANPPTFSLVNNPPTGATINSTTGVFSWTPDFTQGRVAPYPITVRATKASDASVFTDYTFNITVTNVNRAPTWTGGTTHATATVVQGQTLNLTYAAVDPDGDALTYTRAVAPAPAGAHSIAGGVLTFTPTLADAAGGPYVFTITATDPGALTANTTTTVTVTYGRNKGDVDGDGDVDGIDASFVLQHVVGITTPAPLPLTGVALWAADCNNSGNGDGVVGAYDAYAILFRVLNGTFPAKVSATMGNVAFGRLSGENGIINVPITISNTIGVTSAYAELLTGSLEVANVKVASADGWVSSTSTEGGKVKIAMTGLEPLKNGVIAVVSFKLNGQESVAVTGSAVLNDDLSEDLQSVSVREIPTEFALSQNYPNPFNPTTSIKYSLVENAKVTLVIYDMLGQVVKTLVDNEQEAGFYTIKWDGTNNYGGKVSSGIYIYRLNAGKFMSTLKMNLLK